MFTTLSTTTRRLAGGEERILLTDTVGFIDEVPVWLIEAFRATLEEVYEADAGCHTFTQPPPRLI